MAKRRRTYRRRRVSGVGKDLFSTKNLIPAAAVIGVSYFAGDSLPVTQTKTTAKIQTAVGAALLFTNFLGKSPTLKGIGLGLIVDGGKKVMTGNDWKGNPLPEGEVAGLRPYYLDQPAGQITRRQMMV